MTKKRSAQGDREERTIVQGETVQEDNEWNAQNNRPGSTSYPRSFLIPSVTR